MSCGGTPGACRAPSPRARFSLAVRAKVTTSIDELPSARGTAPSLTSTQAAWAPLQVLPDDPRELGPAEHLVRLRPGFQNTPLHADGPIAGAQNQRRRI